MTSKACVWERRTVENVELHRNLTRELHRILTHPG